MLPQQKGKRRLAPPLSETVRLMVGWLVFYPERLCLTMGLFQNIYCLCIYVGTGAELSVNPQREEEVGHKYTGVSQTQSPIRDQSWVSLF